MKYIVFVAVLAFASAAFGQYCPDPTGTEVEVWKWVDGVGWVSEETNPNCALARLWASNSVSGECNKICWEIPVQIHASIAQWIKFTVTGTRWDWRIMKPGTYAGDCITFEICSNGDVGVDYEGFDDLYSATSNCDNTIMTWYAWGRSLGDIEQRNGWVRAPDLNDDDDIIEEVCENSHCWQTKLWTKVQVDSCNSACEYHDDATVKLCLINQKCWVDSAGHWASRGPCIP